MFREGLYEVGKRRKLRSLKLLEMEYPRTKVSAHNLGKASGCLNIDAQCLGSPDYFRIRINQLRKCDDGEK